jgi:hypothetical protein
MNQALSEFLDWRKHGYADAKALGECLRALVDEGLDQLPYDGHRHIHGANLGISATAYLRAGGFPPLACHEDVHLVSQLERCGARIAWSCRPRVTTSTRLECRAVGGFGDYLRSLAEV